MNSKSGVLPLDEGPATFKVIGAATLTAHGGTATLRVKGTNDMGETMDMTAVCQPQQK